MLDTIYDVLSIVFILLAIVLHVFMIAAVINMFFLKGRKITVMVERYRSNDVNMDAEEDACVTCSCSCVIGKASDEKSR